MPDLWLATLNGQPVVVPGEVLRDEGIDQVLAAASPAWITAVTALIYNLPEGWEGIFEEIRLMAESAGLRAHRAQAWGGIAQTALNNGTLRYKTPLAERRMISPRSHARTSKMMVRTGKI
jgi:hypothetical protein